MKSWLKGAFLLALVTVSASCSDKGKGRDEPGNTESVPQPAASAAMESSKDIPKSRLKELGALVDLIVAEDADLPKAEFDPAALVAAVGRDPQKLFEWVRDRTWWAPYRGLLRGAKGVMLDRVGSNLDRAVLLGDLLRRAGYTVRLAHTRLPESRARELLAKVRPIPDQRRSSITPRVMPVERQRAAEALIPGLEQTMQQQVAEFRRSADEAAALVRSQVDRLFAAVKGAARHEDNTSDTAAVNALRDYWWVEREETGKWIAMDVLLPDVKMGGAQAAASEFSEWKAGSGAPSIPDLDWHTVQIRVVVERYLAGATSESTVLETTLRPVDVLERPITLSHIAKPWPDTGPDPKTDANAFGNAAVNVREWIPILQVGDDVVAQSGFTDGGELKSNPLNPVAELAGAGNFGLASALGGGDASAGQASAEWIDYEIRVPGEPSQRLRRPVFDLLGPAKRASKIADFDGSTQDHILERFEALWGPTDILLQPCDFIDEYITHRALSSVVANRAVFSELSQEHDPEKVKKLAYTILERLDIWGPLTNVAFWRSALGRQSSDWFIDRPNVLSYRITQPVIQADKVGFRELVDVAANSIGVRRAASKNPFEVRLERGVADTVAEMLALGSNLHMAENTASVFSMAGDGPARSLVIASHKTAAARELGWPADETARLVADIDAGFTTVALKQPVVLHGEQRVGWWRVDPASGETIGVMGSGFHAADERTILENRIAFMRNYMKKKAGDIRMIRQTAGYGNPDKAIIMEARLYRKIELLLRELDAIPGGFP